ncbi:MAG: hypothetical protein M3072_07950 [Candidatus Dormibacteraeota bacterium]|nr:hypothetical protein [Candidatus Dormibacteraeota bacterium]
MTSDRDGLSPSVGDHVPDRSAPREGEQEERELTEYEPAPEREETP